MDETVAKEEDREVDERVDEEQLFSPNGLFAQDNIVGHNGRHKRVGEHGEMCVRGVGLWRPEEPKDKNVDERGVEN